jgi:hypothetical protein
MLRDKIQKDYKKQLKAGNKKIASVLRFLYSEIKNKEINKGRKELTDDEVISLINKQLKELKENLKLYKEKAREELVEKTNFEMKTIKKYLPEQISDQELEEQIQEIIDQFPDAANPGPIIGKAIKEIGSKASNSRISKKVRELFSA